MRPTDAVLKRPQVSNPCLFYAPGNSLTAYERQQPSSASGGRKALSLTGSGAVRHQPAFGARINLIKNPRFANDATGWSNLSGSSIARISADDIRGTECCEVTCTASASDGLINTVEGLAQSILTTGFVSLSADIRLMSGATDWLIKARGFDASVAIASGSSAVTLASGWARYSVSFALPICANQHYIGFTLQRASAAAGVARITNVVVETSATAVTNPSYFDGSSSNVSAWLDPITGYLGTAHASPSVSQAAFWPWEATTNTVTDPSFEAATITTNWTAAGIATISKVTTHAKYGSNGGKVSCTASTSDGIDQLATSGAAAANGQSWTNSGSIRAFAVGDVGKTVTPVIIERTSADAVVVTNVGSAITLTDAWQDFAYTKVLAGGGTVAKVTLGFRAGAATAVDFVLDGVDLCNKNYATPHCNGALGTGHAWTSTAHASSSTRTAMVVKADETNRISPYSGSVFALVKPELASTTDKEIVRVGDGTAGLDQLRLVGNTSLGTLYHSWTSNGAVVSTTRTSVVVVNTWLTAYADWKGALARLSANGGAMGTGARNAVSGSLASSNDLRIGSFDGIPQNVFNGIVGPVLIYSEVLTAAEIAKLVALGAAANFTSILRVS